MAVMAEDPALQPNDKETFSILFGPNSTNAFDSVIEAESCEHSTFQGWIEFP
jgi:hypothetical protein